MSQSPAAPAMLDAIVVGAGPAGLTAATYLRRFHRDCLVLDAGDSRARWIPESNNCPGFPHGVSGDELLRLMREQARKFGARFEHAEIDAIRRQNDGFVLSAGPRQWRAHCVILATGVADTLPEASWTGDAVACGALRLCAVCDAWEATDSRIGVYGPLADIAAHGLFLRSYSEHVTLLPTDPGSSPGDGAVEALRQAREAGVALLPAGGRLEFDGERCSYRGPDGTVATFDSVYPYLGARTSAGIAAAAGAELTGDGTLVVDAGQTTSVPGLYAIGDVVSGLNQVSVAVGQAAVAATRVHARLPHVPRVGGDAR
ncbi:NAD(P)/FAD-dependent oxidoreductase [Luteimonas sp. RD2P54]|uniref:NAD(P)/FAD-dependent oxidoreductase n=1 Tax=Luteimonas endophytica TaxID=3042023 RepID=A0ABT6J7K4_9GAMM|nr:NAD(P)/FAD-dependent oxidoreductase [Luteimonas endophytica]MDH5822562.1 NAD(P)/FAD-dependent oxidoreductase [Luteimonas endophytica]